MFYVWYRKGIGSKEEIKNNLAENYFLKTYFNFINKSYSSTESRHSEYLEYRNDYLSALSRSLGDSTLVQVRELMPVPEQMNVVLTIILEKTKLNLKIIREITQNYSVNHLVAAADCILKIMFIDNLGYDLLEKYLHELDKQIAGNDLYTKASILNFFRDGAEYFDKPEKAAEYLNNFCSSPELYDQLVNDNSKDFLQIKNVLNRIKAGDKKAIELTQACLQGSYNVGEELVFNKLYAGIILMEYAFETNNLSNIFPVYELMKGKLNEFAIYLKNHGKEIEDERHNNFIKFTKFVILTDATIDFDEDKYNKTLSSLINKRTIDSYYKDSITKISYVLMEEIEKVFRRFYPRQNQKLENLYNQHVLDLSKICNSTAKT